MTIQYVATINTAGYLPVDDDPPVFDTMADAWQWLADERERDEDDTASDEVAARVPYSETVDTLHAMVESPALGSVSGGTPGYQGSRDLGLIYSVSEAI